MVSKNVIKQMGLTGDEYKMIKERLGKNPNYTELGMFSAMWSEHCSYKNSKKVLKLFPTKGKKVLQGPGENAGIIDLGDKIGISIKIESHNHPSAIEPYEAAATGGGGCLRDVFTMGATPVALLGSLRLGRLESSRTRYLLKNISKGFVDYANKVDIPVVGGEIYFDESYEGNPLVNAFTVGLVKHGNITTGKAKGRGSLVLIVGRPTGRDGVEGAALASAGLTEEAESRSSAVALGDPKMGKLLSKACLELIRKGLAVGMQDMGAAGLTCSLSETAYRAGTGMEVDLDLVPKSEKKMTAYETLLSESQERMLVIVRPGNLKKTEKIFKKWGVPATIIGKVTGNKILRIKEKGQVVAEMKPSVLTEAPVYVRKHKRPGYLKKLNSLDLSKIKEPVDYNKAFVEILGSPTIRSKYSLYKSARTDYKDIVVGPGSDAAVMKVPGSKKKVAVTVDGNSTYCLLSPYRGGMICIAEAARNLAVSGAKPLGVTDGLNFGNPHKPEVYWQFRQSVMGISRACRNLDIPVVSGNVSFNNENPKGAVDPSPVVGMAGVIEEGFKVMGQSFKKAGDVIILLGKTKNELGASQYLKKVHNLKRGLPPALNLNTEKKLHKVLLELNKKRLISSAHDCSEGGIATAVAESCIMDSDNMVGAVISGLPFNLRADAVLFSESQSRAVISCSKKLVSKIESIAKKNKVPVKVIGVTGGKSVKILNHKESLIDISLKKLSSVWRKRMSK